MAPWKLPLIVAALILPIVGAFVTVGPALGVAVGALAVLALLVVAARQRPTGPIGVATAPDEHRRLLLVVTSPVEEPQVVSEIAHEARADGSGEQAEVLILAPARIGFLDRWASDVESARRAAQRNLVVTVAALAKVGIAAEARVGDEDLVQAVEDQLQSFAASEVIVVSPNAEEGGAGDTALSELESRLQIGFRHLVVSA